MHHGEKNLEAIGRRCPASHTDFQTTDRQHRQPFLSATSPQSSRRRCPGTVLSPGGARAPLRAGSASFSWSHAAIPFWFRDAPRGSCLLGLEALTTNIPHRSAAGGPRSKGCGRREIRLSFFHSTVFIKCLCTPDEVPAPIAHPGGEGRQGPKFGTPQPILVRDSPQAKSPGRQLVVTLGSRLGLSVPRFPLL